MMQTVYKIVGNAEWQEAIAAGRYLGSAHDARDGFIHLSMAAQVAETAAKHFADRTDLLLVAVDAQMLGDALRLEPSRGGALFPHLYGALSLAAVVSVSPLPLGADGLHALPPLIDSFAK